MNSFIAKPIKVKAEQFAKGVNTPPGVRYNPRAHPEAYFKVGNNAEVMIESGEWIVIDEFGNLFKISDKQFHETYIKE